MPEKPHTFIFMKFPALDGTYYTEHQHDEPPHAPQTPPAWLCSVIFINCRSGSLAKQSNSILGGILHQRARLNLKVKTTQA